ncbi:MAG: DNA-binding protein [Deltaproteobacteria bacterium]|nr:MAG: DNA-binding protein [Deltaproteobacteria bacterium]
MSIVIEKEGKTVSEAIISLCEELGLARDEIEVEVLEEGSKGVLGIGSKNARIRAKVKRDDVSEKGLRAKRVLEIILGFFISDYSVNLKETSDRIKLEVRTSEDKGLLIGKQGETLKAMEFLVGKIAGRVCKDGKEKRVSIDIAGYKKRREEAIAKMVKEAAEKARRSGKPVTLEPMSPFERRIAYMTLKKENGLRLETKSEGNEKRITIIPTGRSKNKGVNKQKEA